MQLTFHPAAAAALETKSIDLLAQIEKLEPAKPSPPAFKSERVISAHITDKDIIGSTRDWLSDVKGQRIFAFIHRDDGVYGFSEKTFPLLKRLSGELLKIQWVQDFLSETFIENTIIDWCEAAFEADSHPHFTESFSQNSAKAIQKLTLWAPVAHLDVEKPFTFGPALIAPMTAAMFDDLESKGVQKSPKDADHIRALVQKYRKKMQGGAAVVLEIEAETGYAYDKGLALAADVIGLLRFFSPGITMFWVLCPAALLGAELIPLAQALLFNNGEFNGATHRVVPKDVAHWQLSETNVNILQNRGLNELGQLIAINPKHQFHARLRSCILALTKGATFPDVADRLIYTCSALEGLLLKNTSEPIQQNLGERMAFLIGKEPDRRAAIVANVRNVYKMRSEYIHHRISSLEETELNEFTVNAHHAFRAALSNMRFKTPTEFVDALDHLKYGGGR